MKNEEIQKMLFVSTSEKYGDRYIEHLLEQYKIYVNSAEKISDRRQKTNEFFLTLDAAFVTILGFFSKSQTEISNSILFIACLAGITICYLWYRIILSYKGLNTGKFKVIHYIEKRLPLALYDTEWEILGRGEKKETYWPFTHIELCVPWIFIGIYSIIVLLNLPWDIIGIL